MSVGLVLIGPPGVGKGTQAARLREEFGLEHIATGDLLRDHCSRGTALGRAASEHMDAGRLVPDELVVAMVEERIRESPRFLLDGFPRTLAQAEALDRMLDEIDRRLAAVLNFQVPDEVAVERLYGRAVQEGRSDDTPEVIQHRLDVFHSRTAPVVEHYRAQGILVPIDGQGPVESVFGQVQSALQTAAAE
jgi:adenylate kinase